MNTEEFTRKADAAINTQLWKRGYTASVDVLMDIGVLTKQKYEDWRRGKIPYLEAACTCNLRRLSLVNHEIRSIASKRGLKPSYTYYGMWGGKKQLRFSKTGQASIEKSYATHYIDTARIAQLKAEKNPEQ